MRWPAGSSSSPAAAAASAPRWRSRRPRRAPSWPSTTTTRPTARARTVERAAAPAPRPRASPPTSPTAPQAEELVARVIERFGRVDGLVNNAGRTQVGPFLEIEPAEWDEVIRDRPDGRVSHLPGGPAVDGRAGQRRDRQRRLAAGPDGRRRDGRLQRREGGADRPDPGAGPRVRAAGHPRQRRRAGRHGRPT